LISAYNQFSSPKDHQHPTNDRSNLNFLQFLMKVNNILRINNNPSFQAKIFMKYSDTNIEVIPKPIKGNTKAAAATIINLTSIIPNSFAVYHCA